MPLNYSFSCRVRDERKLKLKFSSEKEQALIFQREDAQKKHTHLLVILAGGMLLASLISNEMKLEPKALPLLSVSFSCPPPLSFSFCPYPSTIFHSLSFSPLHPLCFSNNLKTRGVQLRSASLKFKKTKMS